MDSLFSRRYGLDEEEEGEGEDKAEEEEEDRRAFYRSDSRLPGAPGCASSPQVLQQMGNTAFRKNDHEEAIRCFDEAILQCSRGNGLAESLLVALYSNRSAVLCAIHRYEEALADADQAVELNPTWSRGHSRRGNALHAMAKRGTATKDAAREAYERALQLDPENSIVRRALDGLIATMDDNEVEVQVEVQESIREGASKSHAAERRLHRRIEEGDGDAFKTDDPDAIPKPFKNMKKCARSCTRLSLECASTDRTLRRHLVCAGKSHLTAATPDLRMLPSMRRTMIGNYEREQLKNGSRARKISWVGPCAAARAPTSGCTVMGRSARPAAGA
jgi:tetratricopeptide (TPR) repeat protein